MEKRKVVYRKAGELHRQESNPRLNEDAVPAVQASIRRFGFWGVLIIDADNNIWAGDTRYQAGVAEGMDEFPCMIATDLTAEELRAFRIADNKVAEFAKWDEEKLVAELGSIVSIDMAAFGFDALIREVERSDIGAKLNTVFEVVVECRDEVHMEEVYNALREGGYQCRISTL